MMICVVLLIILVIYSITIVLLHKLNLITKYNNIPLSHLTLTLNQIIQKSPVCKKYNIKQVISEKSKFEALTAVLTDGVILLDKERRLIFCNQTAITICKFFKHIVMGTSILNYLPNYLEEKLITIFNEMINIRLINNVQPYTQKKFSVYDDNTKKTLTFIVTNILDQRKKIIVGFIVFIQDTTKEKDICEIKTKLISNLSHELRTPLFNIQSFLETLIDYDHLLTYEQKAEFLSIASRETTRLACLVHDILDLSRLESDFHYSINYIDLEIVIKSVVKTFQIRAYNQKILLVFQLHFKLPKLKGSYDLLVQGLSNLLDNCIKFTYFDSRIILKVYYIMPSKVYFKHQQKYNKVRIEIIDEGQGIGQFDQSRVFDRFVSIESKIRPLDSTGLGLSIVKNIVEKHHSHIYLYSELQVGTSFWFDLLLYS